MSTSYTIELSKSARATCPGCKEKIAKGDMRIVATSEGGQYNVVKNHHVGCFKLPRKLQSAGIEAFIDDELMDTSDDQNLLTDRRDEIIQLIQQAAENVVKKKKAKKAGDDTSIMGRIKLAASGEREPAKKKQKTSGESDSDFDALVKEYNAIMVDKPNVETLKDYLRWNKQTLKGNKDFVLFKVLDGKINGRIGNCLLCGGKLKLDDDMEMVTCNGTWDDDSNLKINCSFKDHRLSERLPRHEFFNQEPTEEQKEAMEKETAEASGKASATTNPKAQAILEKAAKIEWTLNNKKAISAAAGKLVSLLEGEVSLPAANAKQEVGKILLSNKDSSPQEICKMVIEKFGFAEDREAKQEMKEKAMELACKNPKNGAMLAAMSELAQYYFKEGNPNAGASYTKVSNAIKDISEEITAKNAMSFAKGKNKVPGIGPTSGKYMKIFAEKGSFDKLEKKREMNIPGYTVPSEWEEAVEKLQNK